MQSIIHTKRRDTSRQQIYAGRRSSMAGGNSKMATLFQPTYRLEPIRRFKKERVANILKSSMSRYLEGFSYDPTDAKELSMIISQEVKLFVKKSNFDRFVKKKC